MVEFQLCGKVLLEASNARSSGFYKLMLDGKHILNVQGNPWGSCGINLLYNWQKGHYTANAVDKIDEIIEGLKTFSDQCSDGLGHYTARRYLIQTTSAYTHYSLLKAFIERSTPIGEYENLSHNSSPQLLYMLTFPKD